MLRAQWFVLLKYRWALQTIILAEWTISSLNKFLYLFPTKEDWRSSICLALFSPLCFVVELLFQYVRRVIPFNTPPAPALLRGTVINHNTEKQNFICIQLPSTFEVADLELNFFLLLALSFSSVRGYDLTALSYLPCFFSETWFSLNLFEHREHLHIHRNATCGLQSLGFMAGNP